MSLAVLKRKAFARAKIKNKKKYSTGFSGPSDRRCCAPTQKSTDVKSSSYHNYLKRKTTRCLCPDDVTTIAVKNRNIVRDRINRRIIASQHIENVRLATVQKITCDNKNNNNSRPVWKFTINSQSITESAGVVVTQGNSTGTLKTALTGAGMTTVVIYGTKGSIWNSSTNLVIGNTTVTAANIITAVCTKFCSKKCGVPRSRVGYTRKESILRFCNTTKNLNIAGKGKSYNELYDAMKSQKAFSCDDLKKENANDPKCRVY